MAYGYYVETMVDAFPDVEAFGDSLMGAIAAGNVANEEFLPDVPWHCPHTPTASFTADRKQLANRLKTVCGFVPRRAFKAILQNVRVSVNGTVELAATDCEIGVALQSDIVREGDRVALVPAKQFYDVVRKATGSTVLCELTDGRLTVRGSSGEVTIPTDDDLAEYPVIGPDEPTVRVRIESGALALAIEQTIFATDEVSTRYALGGVMFEIGSDTMTLAATDTRRLAVSHVTSVHFATLEGKQDEKTQSPVVPTKFLHALAALLKSGEYVELQFSTNGVCVIGDGWTAVSRLVEGRFPRYQDVIPHDFTREIAFHKAELLAALESAATGTSEESRGVDIKFGNVTGDTIATIRGKSYGRQSAAVCYAGQAVHSRRNRTNDRGERIREDVITFDPQYIVEYLRALPKSVDYVQIAILDQDSAAVLTAAGVDGLYVAMPLSPDR